MYRTLCNSSPEAVTPRTSRLPTLKIIVVEVNVVPSRHRTTRWDSCCDQYSKTNGPLLRLAIRNQGEASRYGKTGRVAVQEGNMRMIERCPVNTHYLVNFLGSGEDIRAIDGCSSFVDIDELQLTGGDDVVFMQLGQ